MSTLKPRSNIQKGKRLEDWVNHQIELFGFGRAVRTPGSGSGKLKGDSFNNLPFLLECKNEKTWHWPNIDQAKYQAIKGNWDRDKWALIMRDPRKPEFDEVYAVIDFGQFLELLKRSSEPIIKEPDRQTAWHIKDLVRSAKQVLKDFGHGGGF